MANNLIANIFTADNVITFISFVAVGYASVTVRNIKQKISFGDGLINTKLQAQVSKCQDKWDDVKETKKKVDQHGEDISAIKESLKNGNNKFEAIEKRINSHLNGKKER